MKLCKAVRLSFVSRQSLFPMHMSRMTALIIPDRSLPHQILTVFSLSFLLQWGSEKWKTCEQKLTCPTAIQHMPRLLPLLSISDATKRPRGTFLVFNKWTKGANWKAIRVVSKGAFGRFRSWQRAWSVWSFDKVSLQLSGTSISHSENQPPTGFTHFPKKHILEGILLPDAAWSKATQR